MSEELDALEEISVNTGLRGNHVKRRKARAGDHIGLDAAGKSSQSVRTKIRRAQAWSLKAQNNRDAK